MSENVMQKTLKNHKNGAQKGATNHQKSIKDYVQTNYYLFLRRLDHENILS